jgi:putative membrane protein
MSPAIIILVSAIALLHFFIFVVEVLLWTKPLGIRMFKLSNDFAEQTKKMAINQGFYNSFLASGLVLSIFLHQQTLSVFILICIFVAGIVGGITSRKKIIAVQSLPALIALLLFAFKI